MASANRALAARIWPILGWLAKQGDKTTYGELAKDFGLRMAFDVVPGLTVIQDHCEEQGLPPLTILVVNKDTRQPGEGFLAKNRGREPDVLAFAWGQLPNPFS